MKNKIFSSGAIIAASVSFLLLPLNSCEKELEVTPYSYFTTANFFKTSDEANMAVLGVYEAMSSFDSYGWNISILFDTDTDIQQINGLSADDWRMIPHYQGISQTNVFYAVWSKLYEGIDRANVAIERIPQMALYTEGTQAQKDQLNKFIGEAKFLRGFYYSELVRLWGDVPFKIKSSQAGDDLKGGLVDKKEIYTQIIKDMQEAALLLPEQIPTDERVNKWAAKAMLARVALFAGGYSLGADGTMSRPANYKDFYKLAQQQINEVMAQNPYKLNPSYSKVFKNQCLHVLEPTENIFQVAFYNPAGYRENSSNIGNFNGVTTANGFYSSTNSRCVVPKPFYNGFNAADQRRDFSIAMYTLNAAGNKVALLTTRQDESWTVGKWSREFQTNSIQEKAYSHINWVIMRYSDLLLMRAEVENELNEGPNAIAYDAINQVRRRGFGADVQGSRIAVDLKTKGTGYSSAANVVIQITGGGGSDASAAVVTLASGAINTIAMLRTGDGYTSVPTVTITSVDGKGSGATATARILPKPTTAEMNLPTGLDKTSFLKALQQERAWELSFEGMRRADLIRWGILGDKITETANAVKLIRSNYFYPSVGNFVAGKHELYPYPQNETDVNKNITRQNPKY
ncbi:MAG: RagB/SusD family nutrient uptake outer membrane protein [Flavobacterium sp.]|uniref:RagB/SusD family nutrient uptake outer membrane protein n=2 Tax=Flavobacterium TaxID=237 RepID=A0ABX4CYK2_9FLAO|nr:MULTISPECIES: RagB/SusD family nutrient uptake outer membrane protein [Flavobacterium]OXB10646.1 RagB/SusD family nutrient uptake outer membrane protein [Flavobacterium plurextorum]PIF70319.1 putative outer membrane starch-binding protein [Flavobacterium sp. 2]UUW07484.1 RagB/SusD family nutrient uptake outer membrane protein [Flavobacterium plurextorum]